MARRVVRVALGGRGYEVHLVGGGLEALGSAVRAAGIGRAVVVTEEHVAPHWRVPAEASLDAAGVERLPSVVLPAGEVNKHLDTWRGAVEALLGRGVDRDTAVVAVGGGVLGDVAGFAAAATLRGVPLVQVPTTLLAMVDASVGGKTGVNAGGGKNLVGAFHQPRLVFAAEGTLATLPRREVVAAFPEIAKTALLFDAPLWTALASGDAPSRLEVVASVVAHKARIVEEDEHEHGRRALLNLGHTVAHALETAAGFTWLHGEAVGVGLLLETRWAVREGLCEDPGLPDRIEAFLHVHGLPASVGDAGAVALRDGLLLDKKARGATLRLPVVVRAGRAIVVDVPRTRLPELLVS